MPKPVPKPVPTPVPKPVCKPVPKPQPPNCGGEANLKHDLVKSKQADELFARIQSDIKWQKQLEAKLESTGITPFKGCLAQLNTVLPGILKAGLVALVHCRGLMAIGQPFHGLQAAVELPAYVTLAEMLAILRLYTGNELYQGLNSAMNDQEKRETQIDPWLPVIKLLELACRAVPTKFRKGSLYNKPLYVFRGVNWKYPNTTEPNPAGHFRLGSIRTFWQFTSHALTKQAAATFAGQSGTIFRVLLVDAPYLEPLSCYPWEQEVLLAPLTKYRIVRVSKDGPHDLIDLVQIKTYPAVLRPYTGGYSRNELADSPSLFAGVVLALLQASGTVTLRDRDLMKDLHESLLPKKIPRINYLVSWFVDAKPTNWTLLLKAAQAKSIVGPLPEGEAETRVLVQYACGLCLLGLAGRKALPPSGTPELGCQLLHQALGFGGPSLFPPAAAALAQRYTAHPPVAMPGTTMPVPTTEELLGIGARAKLASAQLLMGAKLERQGRYAKAAASFKAADSQGYEEAAFRLGLLYEFDRAQPRVPTTPHRAACEQYYRCHTHAEALFRRGRLLLLGLGIDPDVPLAVKLLERALVMGCLLAAGPLSDVYQSREDHDGAARMAAFMHPASALAQ